jgi:hypothetical protein
MAPHNAHNPRKTAVGGNGATIVRIVRILRLDRRPFSKAMRGRVSWNSVEIRGGSLREAVGHFVKVTRSYWPGRFACYDAADLPRTNNDLEQFFGSYRYHERRASGRKVASPGTVVRGSVRLVASAATRLGPVDGADLAPSDRTKWRLLRGTLDGRQATRTLGRRFRRDPRGVLAID